MKKLRGIFLSILVGITTAPAQTVVATTSDLAQLSRQVARAAAKNTVYIPWEATLADTGLTSTEMTQHLKEMADQSLTMAKSAVENIPYPYRGPHVHPRKGMEIVEKWQLEQLHPDMPYLKKTKHLASYFVSKENRLVEKEIERLKRDVWPQLEARLPELEQAAQNTPQPADPLRYVAQHLPLSVNTLFVGEMHGFEENSQAVHKLLVNLRQTQPNRPIILFTEFLPEYFIWKGKIPWKYNSKNFFGGFWAGGFDFEYYRTLWEQARKINITTVGLEPYQACLVNDAKLKVDSLCKEDERFDASLIGLQYRNEKFLEVLRAYRELNPNALFVVYTGAGHIYYSAPFPITPQFKPQETSVIALLPSQQRISQVLKVNAGINYGHPTRYRIQIGDFPQNFQLFNKELAPIAGVDALIRLETPKE